MKSTRHATDGGGELLRIARLLVALLPALTPGLRAQGHGPLYGLSTPTLGRGGWSLDVAAMSRLAGDARSLMVRPMMSYGVTEDLQLSVSAPVPLVSSAALPVMRALTRMPATRDLELMLGWRPQMRATGVGTRQETTVWLAVDVPLDDSRAGVPTAPALYGAAVTGYASRSLYVWLGGAYRRALEAGTPSQRAGDVAMGSLVVGYRPAMFRSDYPAADWRAFLELVAEHVDPSRLDGTELPDTGGRQLYAGLTVLGLYGSWGLSGGPAFPLYGSVEGGRPEEGIRLGMNVSLWL